MARGALARGCRVCSQPVAAAQQVKGAKFTCHEACFKCSHCKEALHLDSHESLYGKLYCDDDFKNQFGFFSVNIHDDDEEAEEKEEGDGAPATKKKEANGYILCTKRRERDFRKGLKLAAGGGGGGMTPRNVMDMIFAIPEEVERVMRMSKPPARFDALLGMTMGLWDDTFWMWKNECYEVEGYLEEALDGLGCAWHELLQNPDEALEIDPEFTRPGVVELLTKMEKKLQSMEYERPGRSGLDEQIQFPWKRGRYPWKEGHTGKRSNWHFVRVYEDDNATARGKRGCTF